VQGAIDIVQADEEPAGKAFLRSNEFLEQRGFSREPIEVPLDEHDERGESPDRGVDEHPVAAPVAARAEVEGDARSAYLLASREKEALLAAVPPEAVVVWSSLGPTGIPQGQTYGSGPGAMPTVAGRVAAIAVDPEDSGHVLVGAAAGGVWQTLDGGLTWTPQTDGQPTLSIGALAFDPSRPSTVYAGTGEGNSAGYRKLGQGILVSSDGGSNWKAVARDRFAGLGFYRLVVDPRDRRRLFAATSGEAAVSVDHGTTWSELHAGMTWDVSLAYHDEELEVLLTAPEGLFAARGDGDPARVDLPGLPPALDKSTERMAVSHAPSDSGQAFVFAAAQGRAHLWHRAAVDQPFVSVALPSFPNPRTRKDVLDVGQASYDWCLAVPPGSDGIVYLGAIELVKGERAGDGLESFQGGWPAVPTWSNISSRQLIGDSIHPDQHAIAFDPRDPNVIYAGNDGGIFRSPDAGNSWQSLNAGLAISEVEYLTQRSDDPNWILAGLQDNGTIRRQGDQDWAQVAGGDGGDCGTNMANPDVCYHSFYDMQLERSSRRGDRGSWTTVTPPNSGRDQFRQLFYPPLEVNARVVVKAGEVVCLSSDSGTTWTKVALPPVAEGPSVASALAIPTTDRVLVATVRGDVFRIDRHPDHPDWTPNPTKLTRPHKGWVSDLLVGLGIPQRYWATFSNVVVAGNNPARGAVFRSDDDGDTWIDVTANLPSIAVNAIVTDPSDPDRVWVACDVGVFESRDAGGTWSVFGTGLPNVLATDLRFFEADRLLRVGTRSRGVWEATLI
jgi:photosystem II stability/assembly factor-like uncharacterized protein